MARRIPAATCTHKTEPAGGTSTPAKAAKYCTPVVFARERAFDAAPRKARSNDESESDFKALAQLVRDALIKRKRKKRSSDGLLESGFEAAAAGVNALSSTIGDSDDDDDDEHSSHLGTVAALGAEELALDGKPRHRHRVTDSQGRVEQLNNFYASRLGKPYEPPSTPGPAGQDAALNQRKSRVTDGAPMSFLDTLELQAMLSGPYYRGRR